MLKKTTLIAVVVVSCVALEAWGQDNWGRTDDEMQLSEESASASESEDADEPFDENEDADEAIDEGEDTGEAVDGIEDAASSEEFESNDEPDGDVAAVQDEYEEEESDDASVDASEAEELADESGAEADASENEAWDEAIASDAAMDLGDSETSGTPDPVSTTRPAPAPTQVVAAPTPAPPQVVAAPTPASPPTNTPSAAKPTGWMGSGTVKLFNDSKGFGFIKDDSGQDVHFHVSGLKEEVRQYDRVVFEVQQGRKGPTAVNIRRN